MAVGGTGVLLPGKGVAVDAEEMIKLCWLAGKEALALRIKNKKARLTRFSSDGCSMWPDEWEGISLYDACFWHDAEYWVGGSQVDKLAADCALAVAVARKTGHAELGLVMFEGVTAGGNAPYAPWRWGFGLK